MRLADDRQSLCVIDPDSKQQRQGRADLGDFSQDGVIDHSYDFPMIEHNQAGFPESPQIHFAAGD
jgi:hypothetical protein